MKEKKAITYKIKQTAPAVLRDAAAVGWGQSVTVRDAKAHLSALLEWVAAGHKLTITSDGKPKAVLSPVGPDVTRKVFTGTLEHLRKMPQQTEGPFAEEIIRADRDGRGW